MLQKCYETLCNGCINTHMSNLGTKSAIVKSGTKSDITESKESETMFSTNTAFSAYTRASELEAASCELEEKLDVIHLKKTVDIHTKV